EHVVGLFHFAAAANDDTLFSVNSLGLDTGMNGNGVSLVPLERIKPKLLGVLEPSQDAGKENAIVSSVRLGPKHADLKAIRRPREDLFDHFCPGHTRAQDHNRRPPWL